MEGGYLPNVHHPEIMRAILAGIVGTGDVIGTDGPGRIILAITVENGLIDKLAALRTDLEDREPEPVLAPEMLRPVARPAICSRRQSYRTGGIAFAHGCKLLIAHLGRSLRPPRVPDHGGDGAEPQR